MANYNDRTLMNIQGGGTYSTNMAVAAELLALPSRGGYALKEIAERAEISERQLRNWRNDSRFQALVEQKTRQNVKERLPDVMEALLDRAINDKSAKHIELVLKYQGLMTDKHEVVAVNINESRRHEIVNEYEVTNSDIERELNDLKALIGEYTED